MADPVFDRVDGVIYKIGGVNPHKGMNWKQYALALVGTNAVMVAIGYLILRIQSIPLFNPNGIGNMEPTLAFNTIISFMTNTNLQHYSGESGLSYLSQMLVIIFMMFVSAASGYAACVAFIRGLAGKDQGQCGQLLCRPGSHHHPHAAALLHRGRPAAGMAGRAPELRGQHRGEDPGGHLPGHRHGSHRRAGNHQAPGHQRRRLPGRQLHHPAGEPHDHLQPDRAVLHDAAARRLCHHLRQDGADGRKKQHAEATRRWPTTPPACCRGGTGSHRQEQPDGSIYG